MDEQQQPPAAGDDDSTNIDLGDVLDEVRAEVGRMAVDLGVARAGMKAERRRRVEAEQRVQELEGALALEPAAPGAPAVDDRSDLEPAGGDAGTGTDDEGVKA